MQVIDSEGHKLGLLNYKYRPYTGSIRESFEDFKYPLYYNGDVYDVYPNTHLYSKYRRILMWIRRQESKNYDVIFDPTFEYVPQYKSGRPMGQSALHLGILFTVVPQDLIDVPASIIWNYLCNQTGKHINLGAYGVEQNP